MTELPVTTNLIQQLKKHEAEQGKHSAGLERQTLLPGDAAAVGVTKKFCRGHTADDMRQAVSHMLQECVFEKQRVYVILPNNKRRIMKMMDDGVPSLGCVVHTPTRPIIQV